MPPFRTFCPTCEIVYVAPTSIVIQAADHHDVVDMSFLCPACDAVVHQPLNWWAVPVLEEAGCTIVDISAVRARHPSSASFEPEPITEAEIVGFRAALDDPDWSQLLHP